MKIIVKEWDRSWKLVIKRIFNSRIKWCTLIMLECECDCWKIKNIRKQNFIHWRSKSCWCWIIEAASKRKTHWLSKDRKFIDAFHSAKKRTLKDKNYIKKWITFLLKDMESFKNNMYESYIDHCNKYWKKNTILDRIDNNWNYEYWNIRWATVKIQINNQWRRIDQKKFIINYSWEEYIFYNKSDCARKFSINITTLTDWLNTWYKPRNKNVLFIKYI